MFTPGSRPCAYRTASGRAKWLNRDPIEEQGGMALYGSFQNDGLNKTDRDGRDLNVVDQVSFPLDGLGLSPEVEAAIWENTPDEEEPDWVDLGIAWTLQDIFGPPQFLDDAGNLWQIGKDGTISPGFLEAGVNPLNLLRCCRSVKAQGLLRSGLQAHEMAGGHALGRHVGKNLRYLRNRLLRKPNLSASSAFAGRSVAEHAVGGAIKANGPAIGRWLQTAENELRITQQFAQTIGFGVKTATGPVLRSNTIYIVLRKYGCGYRIVTAYPLL